MNTNIETKFLDITEENIEIAAKLIAEGKLVAFPTETVYGLGADAMNADAVGKVYAAKGRPSDNPMIVHIADTHQLAELTPVVTPLMETLAEAFWPGPLTMVVPKIDGIPDTTTGGLETVGVRMPSDEVARALIRKSGCTIAAPSANISGKPSPTKAKHVAEDLSGRIDAILMGGDCQVGIESTVVDVTGDAPIILRPGIITAKELQAALEAANAAQVENGEAGEGDAKGEAKAETQTAQGKLSCKVGIDPALLENRLRDAGDPDFKPMAPGMKYKHYAPNADMLIISGQAEKLQAKIDQLKADAEAQGKSVGVILFDESDLKQAAHDFFAKLREYDEQGVDLILAGAVDTEDGVGFAVMNRMMKSAGYSVVNV